MTSVNDVDGLPVPHGTDIECQKPHRDSQMSGRFYRGGRPRTDRPQSITRSVQIWSSVAHILDGLIAKTTLSRSGVLNCLVRAFKNYDIEDIEIPNLPQEHVFHSVSWRPEVLKITKRFYVNEAMVPSVLLHNLVRLPKIRRGLLKELRSKRRHYDS